MPTWRIRVRRETLSASILMLALLLASGLLLPTTTAAQAARPDPAGYLPAPPELPPGFVYQPDQDRAQSADLGSSTFRTYVRMERAPRSPSVLGLHASA